jgi:hypothetical protein
VGGIPTAGASLDVHNSSVGEAPDGRRSPEVGTLSANGSRRWDGQFWVPVHSDHVLEEVPPPVFRPVTREFTYERRSLRLGAAVLAAIVGVVLGSIHFPVSLDSGLIGMMVANLVWALFSYGAVVVILSLGRQGVDVLFLRAILVAFIQGAAFVAIPLVSNFWDATQSTQPVTLGPFPVIALIPWPLLMIGIGLISAVLQGPILAAFAIVANLLWYRSFNSLRPQMRIFNPAPQTPQYPPS